MLFDLDIDECKGDAKICENGVCVNLPATYTCICNDGYKHIGDKCEGKTLFGSYINVEFQNEGIDSN